MPTSTLSDTRALTEYFREYSFKVGYLEDIPDLKNFDEPISRNFIWREEFKFHSEKILSTKLQFSQLEVQTISGWYGQSQDFHKGLFFENTYTNLQER